MVDHPDPHRTVSRIGCHMRRVLRRSPVPAGRSPCRHRRALRPREARAPRPHLPHLVRARPPEAHSCRAGSPRAACACRGKRPIGGDPVDRDQRAVDDHIGYLLPLRLPQRLAEPGCPRSEQLDGFVDIPPTRSGGDADPGVPPETSPDMGQDGERAPLGCCSGPSLSDTVGRCETEAGIRRR